MLVRILGDPYIVLMIGTSLFMVIGVLVAAFKLYSTQQMYENQTAQIRRDAQDELNKRLDALRNQ